MNINIRTSTIKPMLKIFKDLRDGCFNKQELAELLKHEDYQYEFGRYGQEGLPMSLIKENEFIEFFDTFKSKSLDDIENPRLKMRYESYMAFMDELDEYEKNIEKLLSIEKSVYDNGVVVVQNALPENFELEDIDIVFTISIGNSFGWAYKNGIHFDVINFFKFFDVDNKGTFEAFIGHELHHRAFGKLIHKEAESGEGMFYSFLAYEGLAVMYCNNGSIKLTKPFYEDVPKNLGMDAFTWNYFTENYEEIYRRFQEDVKRIRKDGQSCLQDVVSYWLDIFMPDEDRSQTPTLMHTKNYFIGTEVWGLIHDVYGKEKLYEILNDVDNFSEYYNDALEQIDMAKYKI